MSECLSARPFQYRCRYAIQPGHRGLTPPLQCLLYSLERLRLLGSQALVGNDIQRADARRENGGAP
jgi:hypothetical protein